jgi:hypothetical protein
MTRIDLLAQAHDYRIDWVGPLLLCPSEVKRIPARIPGVYLLHVFSDALGGYPIFYAGRTSDLRRRLSEHLKLRSTKPLISAAAAQDSPYWSAAPVLDEGLAAGVESALIRVLQPVCNTQIPRTAPVFVNLPPVLFGTGVI